MSRISPLLGLFLWLLACSPSPTPSPHQEVNTTEVTMNQIQQETTTLTAIPALDASTPAIFETATFGLG